MKNILFNTMALTTLMVAGSAPALAQKGTGGPSEVKVVNDAATPVPVKKAFGETFTAAANMTFVSANGVVYGSLATVPVGKRLVIDHVSGACVTSGGNQVAVYLEGYATLGGPAFIELDTTVKPWGAQTRHTFSKALRLEISGGDSLSARGFRTDNAVGTVCTMFVVGQMYNQ